MQSFSLVCSRYAVGAIGCSLGCNVFQHQNPEAITAAISRVFRDKWPAKEALQELQSKLEKPSRTQPL
jgi:hypothetical protein